MAERPSSSRILESPDDFAPAFAIERPATGPEDLTREAYERGRLEGLHEAEQALEQRLAVVTRRVADALGELGSLSDTLRREIEARFVELALEVASRIVRERVEAGDPVAARALREAIEAFPRGDVLRARLNPVDLESAKSVLSEALAAQRVELEADESIERGGCIVGGGAGTIDARLGTALETVRSAVHEHAEVT